jgi:hypothetical protein
MALPLRGAVRALRTDLGLTWDYVHRMAGHAGKDVAIYSSRNLHLNVVRSEAFKQKKYEVALKVS